MPTPLNALTEYVRVLLGERFFGKADATLLTAMRLVLNSGLVPGQSLTADLASATPGLATPRDFTLLVGHAAKLLITPDSASSGQRMRAFSEQHGDGRHILEELETLLAAAENGGSARAMQSWQDYGGFLRGFGSLEDFWQKVTRVESTVPWAVVSLSAGGVSVATGADAAPGGAAASPPVFPS